MKLTKYGVKEWVGGGVIALTLIIATLCLIFLSEKPLITPVSGYIIISFITVAYLGLAAFFRDPVRVIPNNNDILLSPADGVIKDIELLKDSDENKFFDDQSIVRIGVSLSLLDVHLNRAPCDLKVDSKKYRKGSYNNAINSKVSKENEAMTIFTKAKVKERKFPMIIRQISSATAKRIVCSLNEGSVLKKGEKFGMIKFGSRTELYVPAETWMLISVQIGDRVFAGKTVMATVKPPGQILKKNNQD